MVCYAPLSAYRPLGSVGGPISFGKAPKGAYRSFQVCCGQCVGCRLERSRQWAVRCMHESKMHDRNCFITLTYSDDQLPVGNTLVLKDFQDFMKRLRRRLGVKGIKFYHCGEYGERTSRPHYHACLFGVDFDDKVFYKKNANGDWLYISAKLDDIWGRGHTIVGDVTFQSAAYCARYIMKKVNGDMAKEHYEYVDEDGVIHQRLPEYTTQSRRPGLGATFYRKFADDVYPDDFVLVNGKKARPPRFYDGMYEVSDPAAFERLKVSRVRNARKHSDNNTPHRLKVREEVQRRKLERLKREME